MQRRVRCDQQLEQIIERFLLLCVIPLLSWLGRRGVIPLFLLVHSLLLKDLSQLSVPALAGLVEVGRTPENPLSFLGQKILLFDLNNFIFGFAPFLLFAVAAFLPPLVEALTVRSGRRLVIVEHNNFRTALIGQLGYHFFFFSFF